MVNKEFTGKRNADIHFLAVFNHYSPIAALYAAASIRFSTSEGSES